MSEEDAFADADRSDGVAGSLLNVPFYTLRVISKIPLQSAKRLRRDLETMGFRPAFVYETGSPGTYTVCVGSFETRARAKESGFKEQLDHREYQGDKPFSDCFYFKITEQRRILK